MMQLLAQFLGQQSSSGTGPHYAVTGAGSSDVNGDYYYDSIGYYKQSLDSGYYLQITAGTPFAWIKHVGDSEDIYTWHYDFSSGNLGTGIAPVPSVTWIP